MVGRARGGASIGDYDLQVVYVIEIVNTEIAKYLTRIEQYLTDEKYVIPGLENPNL